MRTLKWILIATVVLAIVAVLIGREWWHRNGAQLMEGARLAESDGRSFGRTATGEQCIDETVRRLGPERASVTATIRLSMFFRACTETASDLAGLCAQDSTRNLLSRVQWFTELCRARGVRNPSCPQLFQPLHEVCGRARSRARGA